MCNSCCCWFCFSHAARNFPSIMWIDGGGWVCQSVSHSIPFRHSAAHPHTILFRPSSIILIIDLNWGWRHNTTHAHTMIEFLALLFLFLPVVALQTYDWMSEMNGDSAAINNAHQKTENIIITLLVTAQFRQTDWMGREQQYATNEKKHIFASPYTKRHLHNMRIFSPFFLHKYGIETTRRAPRNFNTTSRAVRTKQHRRLLLPFEMNDWDDVWEWTACMDGMQQKSRLCLFTIAHTLTDTQPSNQCTCDVCVHMMAAHHTLVLVVVYVWMLCFQH